MKNISREKLPYTVIIANGVFPTHPYPLSYIENASNIVCLDGALRACLDNNINPDTIVGDGDSISITLREEYDDIFHVFTDQETNDLTKAVTFCVKNDLKEIKIVAATGKREDHTMGNISLLLEYMRECTVKMITDYGIFTPISTTTEFESAVGQQVSIFNLDQIPISSHNLKFPLNDTILDNLWKGTLNESLDETFTIETDGPTIVYRTFEVR
ncbi:MAG TPA: thiamine diphosphokinase [Dysgonamonadaceae bacterium]|nr:thiamine diphosphokinase [Dysgonamonadaceae bacterium]